MVMHGSIVQFDPDKEEWTSYVEHLNYYLISISSFPSDKKVCPKATLQSYMSRTESYRCTGPNRKSKLLQLIGV